MNRIRQRDGKEGGDRIKNGRRERKKKKEKKREVKKIEVKREK
jgi:hypothetical protein